VADTIADLKIRVELENAQIKSQIDAIENKFKELGSTVKTQASKVDSFGDATKKLGGILAGAAAVGFLKKAGQEAIENVKSQETLQRQMEKTIGATQAETNAVLAQIDALEKMSNVQAEELRPQFEVFLRSTHDSAQAMDLLNTALNYSAATGKDLSSVTGAMAKAYNGSTTSLIKLAPEIKNVDDKLGYLKENFLGSAEAVGNLDPYAKMELTFKNLQEAVGMTLLPVLQELATWFQAGLEFIKPWLPLIEGLAVAFVTYKIGMMGLVAYQTIYNAVMAISTATTEGFTIALASTGIGAIAIAVGLLTAGLIALNGQMDAASANRNVNYINPETGASTSIDLASIDKRSKLYAERVARSRRDAIIAAMKAEGYAIAETEAGPYLAGDNLAEFTRRFNYNAVYTKAYKGHYQALVDAAKATTNIVAQTAPIVPEAKKKKDTTLTDYLAETQKTILKLQADYQSNMVQAQQNYADEVQSQIDEFRQSFADATNISLGDLFVNGAKSADQLIASLKDKLTSVKQFSEDLGALSAAGYSAEFLKQIVSQGPVVGDQMAKALLEASPEAQTELQSLFKDAQDATAHGVDTLSLSIADQFNVSTKALSDAMLEAANKLNEALDNLQFTFMEKASTIGYTTSQGKLVGKVSNEIVAAKSSNAVNYNITNYVTTNATAEQIATSTVQAIKYGQPTLGVNPLAVE